MYEALKARNEAQRAWAGVGVGGGIPLPNHLTFLDKTVFLDTHNLVLSELGPNVINPKFRHATSYELSVYNKKNWEEYGFRPCPVLIWIC